MATPETSWLLYRELRDVQSFITLRSAVATSETGKYIDDINTIVEGPIRRANSWYSKSDPSTSNYDEIVENIRTIQSSVKNQLGPEFEKAVPENFLTKDIRTIVWSYLGPDLGPNVTPRTKPLPKVEALQTTPESRKRKRKPK
jgi:hypothetical protein